jgi:hypothetical protein
MRARTIAAQLLVALAALVDAGPANGQVRMLDYRGLGSAVYGGTVAWSRWLPDIHRWVLMSRSGGRTRRLPVRSSSYRFQWI